MTAGATRALIRTYRDLAPTIDPSVFLADNVTIVGDVTLGPRVNIWYGSVLRGDVGRITIGEASNVQDLCCLHMTKGKNHTVIGSYVSIGHGAIIHGATLEDGVLVGMDACIMGNVVVGEESIVGAGTLITRGMRVPPRSLVVGRPGRVVRPLRDDEVGAGRFTANRYLGLADDHRASRVL